MKHNKSSRDQDREPASAARATAAADLKQNGIDFVPSPDEVAEKACLNHVNQFAQLGHDVQHCLEAEAQLLAERNLARVRRFHNRT
jgi:hypothetical protein